MNMNSFFRWGFNSVPGSVLIGSLLVSLSILLGTGFLQIAGLKAYKGSQAAAPTAPQAPTVPQEDSGPVVVTLDDDPYIGEKNAPVTIVEFSDYECPFCKRHFEQTHLELKKNYIDTGKVKLIFRDLPLSFHDPMATFEANAANCSREQGGDTTYFKFHDELFKRTKSNGNGLTKDDVYKIGTDLGLSAAFKTCADSEKYKDEIKKDLDYASTIGATGTPTFFIGKSGVESISGTKIVGAQPYSIFQTTIDGLLK